ncbi:HD-GYP domain-containing protein [Cytobacillus sp. NCCP-133]|uniref:HD-GYP domain-containing protein n=1 Tax=Cytobacillus sp. NCCP-133 TaxID=766848 RepID=UPI0022319505|nr:HD-GYP domain-containing protein [Cytobacillus sp. NCCP-133]GLB58977.1 HD family phosphohydrolase [Cytobacillus sp. NCCP-133]
MRVPIQELQEGCILSEDVFSMTNRPIVSRKTVLTSELIGILKAFLIEEAVVERTLVNGMAFIPAEGIVENPNISETKENDSSFLDTFLIGVKKYKKEFQAWQSGLPIDIAKIRNIMIPLIDKMEKSPSDIFTLHHFSTNEDYLFQHAVAVGLISSFIGKKLNLNKGEVVQLALGGCLADSGMAKISHGILQKSTSLSSEEFEEIKGHCSHSFKMVQNLSLLRESTKIGIIQHHERLDGSGYPFGEQSSKINQTGKIIAVADAFHAMTSQRLYRRKQSPFKVLEMLIQDSFGKYDIQSIQALGSGIMTFSIGSRVKLSDGQIGEILFVDDKSPTRPLVKIEETDELVHLEKDRQLFIDEVLK